MNEKARDALVLLRGVNHACPSSLRTGSLRGWKKFGERSVNPAGCSGQNTAIFSGPGIF